MKPSKPSKLSTLRPGDWVALALHHPVAQSRCYVGQVQQVTQRGIQITTVDWLTGGADGWDIAVPWRQIDGALVATTAHDLKDFAKDAGRFQTRHNGEKAAPKKGKK